ncbi:hydroxyacid dehydrogenase [Umezawaea tangerina]|uniref:Phosphoglycerate dehydrogenase-like enzyme n=1 Tax=Umezawaea tangerina TaxID=84725 RepID=A0A2T0TGD2_9PSEU|nr:hydroxyacid dehydrogenase [Umezawaea tangerina]PRY44688.1 phosphoglycerate dehydrogenase-like enzyme [Umezawaea tangerina]
MPGRPRAALAMWTDSADAVFDVDTLRLLGEVCDLEPAVLDDLATDHARSVLAEVELLVTGWGCPRLTEAVLAGAPRLRAVVHTGGSVRAQVTRACWDRGIEVTSAAAANALPVAEYTVAMILLTGKHVLERARHHRVLRSPDDWLRTPKTIGNFGRTIGVLSASTIGRRVVELLRPFDFHVLLHDPYVTPDEAAALGVEQVDLPGLFARSDLVSVHTPLLPRTRGLVSRDLIDAMRPGAVLLNTARGAVVDQDALTDAVGENRIRAVLDVTDPEVLPPRHPLWDSHNVLITPHLAGSQGNEWRRLADVAVAEVGRWVGGEGFAHPVRRELFGQLA